MIYPEEIKSLAKHLESFKNTFICGKPGCGKTSIVQKYLENLQNKTCVIEIEENYQKFPIIKYIRVYDSYSDYSEQLINELDDFCEIWCDKKERKEIIIDNFDLLFRFENFRDYLRGLMDWNTRIIFITQYIHWNMMPIIDDCENLYLGIQDRQDNLNKYRNFTRNLDFTNKNFEVVEKYV